MPLIKSEMPLLQALNADYKQHPFLIHQLRTEVSDKLNELQTTIDLRRAGNLSEALAVVRTDRGRIAMDRIRGLESEAERHEEYSLSLTRQRTRKFANLAQVTGTLGGAGIFVIVLVSFGRISHLISMDKRLNEQLSHSLADFKNLADSVPQMVWRTTEQGAVEYVNQRWIEFSGLSEKILANGGWQALLHPEDRKSFLPQWNESLQKRTTFAAECRVKERAAGKFRWFLFRASPVRDQQSGCRWYATYTDIDQQKQIETALQRANEDLQQFVYSASHDLQEPLRTIMIYSELVQRRATGFGGQKGAEEIRFLRQAAERMSAFVYDLLTYTQIADSHSDRDTVVDGTQVLRRVLNDLRPVIQETGAQITSAGIPRLRISEAHLRQLLQNLIGNAIKYRKPDVTPEIHISSHSNDSSCVVSVRDNGIGIDPSYHKQVFGIFKRLHTTDQYSGTGLGLAICKKVVERHRGHLWVESQLGAGSTFYFTLPCDLEHSSGESHSDSTRQAT